MNVVEDNHEIDFMEIGDQEEITLCYNEEFLELEVVISLNNPYT